MKKTFKISLVVITLVAAIQAQAHEKKPHPVKRPHPHMVSTNVAPQSVIACSSTSPSSFKGYRPKPEHTVDGRINRDKSIWSASRPVAWIMYQLPSIQTVSKVNVYGGHDHYDADLKISILLQDANGIWSAQIEEQWMTDAGTIYTGETGDLYKCTTSGMKPAQAVMVIVHDSTYPYGHLWRTSISEVEIITQTRLTPPIRKGHDKEK